MQKDFKTGLVLGVIVILLVGMWLATRPSLSTKSRIADSRSSQTDKKTNDLNKQDSSAPAYHQTAKKQSNLPAANVPALSSEIKSTIETENYPDKSLRSEKTVAQKDAQLNNKVFHVVLPGQTLSGIAKIYYGSADKWQKIYQANKNVIKNPNKLTPGTNLLIPE